MCVCVNECVWLVSSHVEARGWHLVSLSVVSAYIFVTVSITGPGAHSSAGLASQEASEILHSGI